MRNNTTTMALWDRYILWQQSSFSSFTVSSIRTSYLLALRTLGNRKALLKKKDPMNIHNNPDGYQLEKVRNKKPSSSSSNIEYLFFQFLFLKKKPASLPSVFSQNMLEIFFRLCIMEKQSGYTERFLAYFQALVEFNVFWPKHLVTRREKESFFKLFWESEVPRVGEEKAKGWEGWLEAVSKGEKVATKSTSQAEGRGKENQMKKEEEEDRFQRWVKLETEAEKKDWLPARVSEDLGEDPDRVVLFDDIQEVLFELDVFELRLWLFLVFLELAGEWYPVGR
jgi:hypothetical protein